MGWLDTEKKEQNKSEYAEYEELLVHIVLVLFIIAVATFFLKVLAYSLIIAVLTLLVCFIFRGSLEAFIAAALSFITSVLTGYFKYKSLSLYVTGIFSYIKSLMTLTEKVISGKMTVDLVVKTLTNNWPGFFLFMALGFLAGGILYFLVTTRSIRQVTNEETIKQKLKRYDKDGKEVNILKPLPMKKPLLNIATNEKHSKYNGTIIGSSGRNVEIITDQEAAGHGLVVGTTGSGKTTLLLNFVQSCSERHLPLIFVDGKGDKEFPEGIRKIVNQNGGAFYHFDINGVMSNTTYNPLKLGDESNIRDKLINLTDWSEMHYRVNSERYIMLAINCIDQLRKETEELSEEELKHFFDLRHGEEVPNLNRDIANIQALLDKEHLMSLISHIKDKKVQKEYSSICEKMDYKSYAGLDSRLALLSESKKLSKLLIDSTDSIDLSKALQDKAIVLFSLDSLQNKSVTEMLGRLIVSDLNTAVSLKGNKEVAYAIFDEHGAYINADVEQSFAMARSFGLRIISASQEITDYEKSILGEILKEKIIGCTNFKIILRQNSPKNAEYLAKMIGTKTVTDTKMSSDAEGNFKGLSYQQVDQFVVHPNKIKSLETGQAVVLVKTPKYRVVEALKVREVKL